MMLEIAMGTREVNLCELMGLSISLFAPIIYSSLACISCCNPGPLRWLVPRILGEGLFA